MRIRLRFRRNSLEVRELSERTGPWICLLVALIWLSSFVLDFPTSLALITLVGFLGMGLGLFLPTIGLFGAAVLCTIDSFTRIYLMTGGWLRWNSFNYLLSFLVIAYLPVLLRLRDVHTRILQCVVFLMVLNLSFSPDITRGVLSLLNLVSVFGLTIHFVRALEDRQAFLWTGLLAGSCSAVGGLVFLVHMDSLHYINTNAWSSMPLAGLFCLCLAFYFAPHRSPSQILLGILAVVNLGLAFLTTSRGAILVAVVCLGYMLTLVRSRLVKFTTVAAGLASLAIGASVFTESSQAAMARINRLLNPEYSAAERTSNRSDLALGGIDVFLSNPFGVGTGGFRDEYAELAGEDRTNNAHSAWLMVLAENGFLGLALLTLYVFSFMFEGWFKRRQGLFGLGLLVTFCLAALFVTREFQGKGTWLLAAGGAVMMNGGFRRYRRESALRGAAKHSRVFQARARKSGLAVCAHPKT